MKCLKCDKLTGKYKRDLQTCARCREVLKIDLVRKVLGMTPTYLDEINRHKQGRPPRITDKQRCDIKHDHRNGKSMDKLAKEYGVSKGTIFNTLH